MSTLIFLIAYAMLASAQNTTEDTCELQPWEMGPWGRALIDWSTATSDHSARRGRILALPSANGYYVTDRFDSPLLPPPPPPSGHHVPHGPSPHGPSDPYYGSPGSLEIGPPSFHVSQAHNGQSSAYPGPAPITPPSDTAGGSERGHPPTIPVPRPYEEWHPPNHGPGKIVNKPTNNKDKFKPSYPPPQPPNYQYQEYNYQQHPTRPASDRVDNNPQKQVSETDLLLLGSIEKLTYRLDLMEKRLRKLEESLHYVIAGVDPKPEPCITNFTRVGGVCYHFSTEATDWKTANLACRKLRSYLLELEGHGEKRQLTAAMQSDKLLRDTDWWTGGLNPGLLWIWSHSARPVGGNTTSATSNNTTEMATIVGDGRCLAFVYDPAVRAHVYRGQDCAWRHRYVCEKEEDKARISNEIERVARKLKSADGRNRKPKIMWTDE